MKNGAPLRGQIPRVLGYLHQDSVRVGRLRRGCLTLRLSLRQGWWLCPRLYRTGKGGRGEGGEKLNTGFTRGPHVIPAAQDSSS